MAIQGIGVDMEDVSRFELKPYEQNKEFYNKIFTMKEIDYCLHKTMPYIHFAGKFCAKESVIKALQSDYPLSFKDIEILNSNQNGAPEVLMGGKINKDIKISISHTNSIAIAFSIVIKRDDK